MWYILRHDEHFHAIILPVLRGARAARWAPSRSALLRHDENLHALVLRGAEHLHAITLPVLRVAPAPRWTPSRSALLRHDENLHAPVLRGATAPRWAPSRSALLRHDENLHELIQRIKTPFIYKLAYLHPRKWRTQAPVFNRGSGGGARGCGYEERVGVHARSGGIRFP